MTKHPRISCLVLMFLMLGLAQKAYSSQKILVIVEAGAYNSIGSSVDQYVQDIANYDQKKAELIVWHNTNGSNIGLCISLWQTLQTEYSTALTNGDVVEGAVLVGNIPVPMTVDPYSGCIIPFDQFYMDIIDRNTQQTYANIPWDTTNGNGYFTENYTGDQFYDIWISRINAAYLGDGIKQGGNILDEYGIYNAYLAKVHARMTAPANVPSRGFAMGGLENGGSLHYDLGRYFQLINLPWFAEFTGGDNSSFNWMSQLLAGPRGCTSNGGFDGTLFPNRRNSRYCLYQDLFTVYVPNNNYPSNQAVGGSDTLGWEWAGVYGHSSPAYTDFFSDPGDGQMTNGRFSFGTLGPFWGGEQQSNYWANYGYSGGCYAYQDDPNNANPYSRTLRWKEKKARWCWRVPALPPGSNSTGYNVYVYYTANPNNVNYVEYYLYEMTISCGANPSQSWTPLRFYGSSNYQERLSAVPNNGSVCGQRIHYDTLQHYDPGQSDTNWEVLFYGVNPLTPGSVVQVIMPANRGSHPAVGAISGNYIVDALRFMSTTDGVTPDGNVDNIVRPLDPQSGYPDTYDDPSEIFTTQGVFPEDAINRGYEDMGDESGGGGFSKTQFFMHKACFINNFITTSPSISDDPNPGTASIKNLGNLYGLGHNGLICMGTADDDCSCEDKSPFMNSLNSGNDFGQAFLAQENATCWYQACCYSSLMIYSLLGAGSLHSQPYVQYGWDAEQNEAITTNDTLNLNKPILIRADTVKSSGTWIVTSNNSASPPGGSPPGTYSEIDILPETDLAPTGLNVVDLKANP
jgi:hypothetical protein